MRFIVLILAIVIGAHVGFRSNMLLGGLIQMFGIWYATREFWQALFGK